MKYEIKNRFTGNVQFTADIDCAEDAPTSIKLGLAVRWGIKNKSYLAYADLARANLAYADLAYANLACANLVGADLAGADLAYANLAGANLTGADWGEDKTIPIFLTNLKWPLIITGQHIQIGCERYLITEWQSFTDERISQMHSNALELWRIWKEPILAIAKAAGRPFKEDT